MLLVTYKCDLKVLPRLKFKQQHSLKFQEVMLPLRELSQIFYFAGGNEDFFPSFYWWAMWIDRQSHWEKENKLFICDFTFSRSVIYMHIHIHFILSESMWLTDLFTDRN